MGWWTRAKQTTGRAAAAAMLALVAGCTVPTPQAYRETVQSWVGRPLDDLALNWGAPDRTITLSDGSRLIEYDRQSPRYLPGTSYMEHAPVVVRDADGRRRVTYAPVWRQGPPTLIFERCMTRFRIGRDNRVQDVTFEGPSCVAYPRPPGPVPAQPAEPDPPPSETPGAGRR